jgi:hypothetical protein
MPCNLQDHIDVFVQSARGESSKRKTLQRDCSHPGIHVKQVARLPKLIAMCHKSTTPT